MFGFIGLIIGILFLLFGAFMVVFFPSTTEHQGDTFSVVGIIMGFISLVIGFFLVFF